MFNTEDKALYWRLLQYILKQKKALSFLLVGTIIYGLTEPLVPLILKPLIDGGFAKENLNQVYLLVAILCIGYFIRGIANFTADYAMSHLAQNMVLKLRMEMFEKLVKLPMSDFQNEHSGAMISRFTYDVGQVTHTATDTIAILVRESITILALLSAMLYFNWQLTLFIFILTPIIAGFIWLISKKLRRLAHALQKDMGEINHLLEEALRGRAIIRIHNAQNATMKRFNHQAENIFQHLLQATKINSAISPIIEMLIILTLGVVMILAAQMAQKNSSEMTVGNLVSFLGAMGLLFPPIKRLGKVSEPLQRGLAAMQSIFEFLDRPEEQDLKSAAEPIQKGAITIQNLSFSAPNRLILDQINLTIRAGETIALVGESGSGKSTLASILAGFYSPHSGEIYFDGQSASHLPLSVRRDAIAYVPQETVLFQGTVAENVAYPHQPDPQRVNEALLNAFALDFVAQLPQNTEQIIGENGYSLSGGQRQRLAIARAIYKNAPILILDEATSALDNQSEYFIQEALERQHGQRTCIIIAHRLSTIQNADRIVVLSQGKIVEIGTHEGLLAQNGAYAQLLRHGKNHG